MALGPRHEERQRLMNAVEGALKLLSEGSDLVIGSRALVGSQILARQTRLRELMVYCSTAQGRGWMRQILMETRRRQGVWNATHLS